MTPFSPIFGTGDLAGSESADLNGPLLSIHLSSNRPNCFVDFLDRLQRVTADPSSVEVVVKIDDSDAVMNRLLEQQKESRPFTITYLSTSLVGGFYGLWRSYDDLLRATHPKAYFVVALNDEMYFETKDWDKVLRRYVGLFPDQIFRLRTSKQRYRNYFDFWEAGFANDTSAIMTKRWLELGGGWCPCNGPDTFQQCVAYYFGWLHRFRADRITREIPICDINFGGHGANLGGTLTGKALRRRITGSIRPWFILMSHKMQQEAARRAQKLHAHIWGETHMAGRFEVRDQAWRRRIIVVNRDGEVAQALSYRLDPIRIGLTNAIRSPVHPRYGYFGDQPWNWWKSFLMHLCFRFEYLGRLLDSFLFEPRGKHRLFRSIASFVFNAPNQTADFCKRVWRKML